MDGNTMDEVTPRNLIRGQLPGLKDNRAEAEQLQANASQAAANGVPAANYRPGLHTMMDWVASRLHKAGAAAWAGRRGGRLPLPPIPVRGVATILRARQLTW